MIRRTVAAMLASGMALFIVALVMAAHARPAADAVIAFAGRGSAILVAGAAVLLFAQALGTRRRSS
ncbi:hypothetical protein IP65_07180 [Novosphingobium sp. AAP1]|uniref:hypothetical protein n=1 Tax=Novosphingobium sp. AAP1 TaxID=1523413 RepID=UPI0006B98F78|nr:hypothetical protein [Novosphingobium sp. AAP1]KPF55788.1 hypothetical protein IP65_07180 [Novosphingobium sp. AAP1]